ncbi:Protein of unknown function DUF273 family-containing protein [Strongyloides ratti]|uniref:Nucleotide-diphospho-sugar transferase family-containing protein n=1 Tax=Strongyloides ratti TaxID=34506 RepID=A0A090MYS3_STRRB|nr:Protein of unknown function DUF273 family-containing protein [Strongyloides ratti]CEF67684.1 Protein of unknown function DUF273 family-containing protein [Strongyloides ratti]
MYKRHCVLSEYMKENFKDGDLILVLDADIGIINPSYLLETFVPTNNEEIIFYERIFNHEIMAGSFFLKNSEYTRQFLLNWSNYDFKHPISFDGSDNVGLHYYLLNYIPVDLIKKKEKCYKIWEQSKSWKDCSVFVACIKYIINKACSNNNTLLGDYKNYYSLDSGKIKILKKNSEKRWVRDIWLTDSKWAFSDFMLHGLKMNTIGYIGFGSWYLPIKKDSFNFTLCHSFNFFKNWAIIVKTENLYKKELVESGILNY